MRQNVTFIHTYYSELFAWTNWIFVLDCGDQIFYDRHDSSFQLKTDSPIGKLQISIQLIDWLIYLLLPNMQCQIVHVYSVREQASSWIQTYRNEMEMGQKFVLCLSYFNLMFCCIYVSVVDRGFNPVGSNQSLCNWCQRKDMSTDYCHSTKTSLTECAGLV